MLDNTEAPRRPDPKRISESDPGGTPKYNVEGDIRLLAYALDISNPMNPRIRHAVERINTFVN